MATRDIILTFLAECPDQFKAIAPFGLRALTARQAADA
jgi:hypothetical protein